jgi:hypothetical protein
LLGSFIDPEDGGDMFLRNIGWLSTNYTALHPQRQLFIVTAVRTWNPASYSLLGLFFYPEDVNSTFPLNVDKILPICKVSDRRRQYH